MSTSPTASLGDLLVLEDVMIDPYPTLRRLQREDPVHWCDAIGAWLFTRYEDIVPTFRNVCAYSNEGRLSKVVEYLPAESRAHYKVLEEHFRAKSLIFSDPPDHTRLRALVTKVFNATRVEEMRPRIQELIGKLLDAALDRGQADIIQDIAVPLPFAIVGTIIGVPATDQEHVKRWADELLAFQGLNKPPEAILKVSQQALIDFRAYIGELIRERRRMPRADLLSSLVAAEAEGDKLTEQELTYTCLTLLVAGHETTTSLIGNGLYTILRHPDQWELLKREPSPINSAVEEMLRYESPVARQPRVVKEDIEVRGKLVRSGDVVFQMLNAANRDPEYFENPDQFDIRRQPNKHVSFGMGIHFCVGALLARTETQILFQALLDRAPRIELVDEKPDWDLRKPNSRMMHSLHVRF
jgi:pimeloyl-[acyl-carrier protein] synthase